VLGADDAKDADVAVSVGVWAENWYSIVWSGRRNVEHAAATHREYRVDYTQSDSVLCFDRT